MAKNLVFDPSKDISPGELLLVPQKYITNEVVQKIISQLVKLSDPGLLYILLHRLD